MNKNINQTAPPGKHIYGLVKVGEKGQIVIPKEARDKLGIVVGDSLLVLGDDQQQGVALIKSDQLRAFALAILGMEEEDTHGNP